ncbi:MAG: hypothetical protein GX428_07005 [Candidatus Atribacteria bacterium]|nr:hypothetical protein [Candidatus Atribacteria bacterium]
MNKNRVSFLNNLSCQEGYITSRGKKVWYQIVGAESQGIPLLVLHRGPGCPHDYLEPIACLGNERPVIFEGASHSHHLEKTEEYLQMVRYSLKQAN